MTVISIVAIIFICAIASRGKGVSVSLHVSHTTLGGILPSRPYEVITRGVDGGARAKVIGRF
jgi:hypothetical protein